MSTEVAEFKAAGSILLFVVTAGSAPSFVVTADSVQPIVVTAARNIERITKASYFTNSSVAKLVKVAITKLMDFQNYLLQIKQIIIDFKN